MSKPCCNKESEVRDMLCFGDSAEWDRCLTAIRDGRVLVDSRWQAVELANAVRVWAENLDPCDCMECSDEPCDACCVKHALANIT